MSSLINKKNFKFDLSGKSPAFFLKNRNLKINDKLMKDLINFSKKNNDINCRICLHKNKKDKIHSMIVLINSKNTSKKHKHSKSDEIYNLIQGSFNVVIYKANRVKKKILMSNHKNIIYTVKKGLSHNIEPIKNIIIFHEIKLNPYTNQ
jgi:cupin fold WbuC family metalloprotein